MSWFEEVKIKNIIQHLEEALEEIPKVQEAYNKEIEDLNTLLLNQGIIDKLKEKDIECNKKIADYRRGFAISKEEENAIDEWKQKHATSKKHHDITAIGGQYDYVFTPTNIGTIGEVRCACGDSFLFRDI